MKHIHKYKKINISTKGKYEVYKCVKPGCSHYVPIGLATGMICECNKCGKIMVIGKEQLHGSSQGPIARPRCSNCIERKVKNEINVETIQLFLEKKEEKGN